MVELTEFSGNTRNKGPSLDVEPSRAGDGRGARRRCRRLAAVTAAAMMAMLTAGAASAAAQGVGMIGPGTPVESGVDGVAEEFDGFGAAIAGGDFNGDTYEDAAIGVPYEDVDGADAAGAVNVIYGSSAGLSATKVPDQLWNQNVDDVEGDAEEFDGFGGALAVGDFNGDGYDDLAIGVLGEDVNGVSYAGAVNVIHGSKDGLSATEVPDQLLHQDTPGVADKAEYLDGFGQALAVGRFNGDDVDDLAIGVLGEDVNGTTDAGAMNVIYGSGAGLSAVAGTSQIRVRTFWHQDILGIQDGAKQGERFGWSLATGDFDGDGYDDLAIGVPLDYLTSGVQSGAVNVLHGSGGGLRARGSQSEFWHQNVAGVEDEAESLDTFGDQLAVGDFDGDGYDDLAVGVGESIGDVILCGAVNVIHGSAEGLSATATPDQFWHQDVADVEGEARSSDRFGHGLAVGRFNGDAYDDLAIGAYEAGDYSGSVNVIHGSRHGLNATHVPDQLWDQDVPDVEDEVEFGDQFGGALAAGSFNGDAYDDLAIGSHSESLGTVTAAGAVNVIHGTGAGLSASRLDDQFWNQDS